MKDWGFRRGGSNCMVVTMFLFCFFLKPQMTHISLWKDKPSVKGRWRCLGPCERSGGITYQGSGMKWGGAYPYSLVRLGSKAGSYNVTVVLQTPRPQQTRLMATVSSPDREGERGGRGDGGWSEGDRGGMDFERLKRRRMMREVKWKVKTIYKVRKEKQGLGWGN